MSLRVRRLSEEPGEPIPEEGYVGVNSVMAVMKREDLDAFSSRIMRITPGGHTTMHEHPREHVAIVLTGKGKIETRTDVVEVVSGQIITIPSNVTHRFTNSGNESLALLVMNFYTREAVPLE